jgi:beta-mannosidase
VLFDTVECKGKPVTLPVWLLDDADQLRGASWQVTVRVFDGSLHDVRSETWPGAGRIERVKQVEEMRLSAAETDTAPLFVVVELTRNGAPVDRTFYFVNYEAPQGALFTLPSTALTLRIEGGKAMGNNGAVPAVGVTLGRSGHLDIFYRPGEHPLARARREPHAHRQ